MVLFVHMKLKIRNFFFVPAVETRELDQFDRSFPTAEKIVSRLRVRGPHGAPRVGGQPEGLERRRGPKTHLSSASGHRLLSSE